MAVKLDHPSFIKPEIGSVIYRYLELDKFEKMLSDSALFFCRSDKFSDPFEGSMPIEEVRHRPMESKNIARYLGEPISDELAQKNSEGLAALHRRFRKSLIINCWHINNGESDAMWRLYLKTNEGVAIQSSVNSLINAFQNIDEEIYMSKVRYINYETGIYYDENEFPNVAYTMFTPIVHKRTAFIHEAELRIFQQIEDAVEDEAYWDNQSNHIGRNAKCDIGTLIEKIILPPTSDKKVYDKVKSIIHKYGFDFKMEKSKLSNEPVY